MVKILKAKIWRTGNSFVITIPSDYINNKLLDLEKEYQIEFKEVVK